MPITLPLFQVFILQQAVGCLPTWPHVSTCPSDSKFASMLQEAENPYISLKCHKGTQHTLILNTVMERREGEKGGKDKPPLLQRAQKNCNLSWIICDSGRQGHIWHLFKLNSFFTLSLPLAQAFLFYLCGNWGKFNWHLFLNNFKRKPIL